jgi:hypothetical protein
MTDDSSLERARAMRADAQAAILTGIRAYLRTHFPDVEFHVKENAKSNNVILEAGGRPRYRLEVTERFLDGQEGAAKSLERVQQWDVAAALREARTKLVTLATTGLHISVRPQWGGGPTRR